MASEPSAKKNDDARPDFEIQIEDGRGLLLLRPRTFFGWLRVDRLELLIPNVTFPLDITGGMAQFQKQTCRILRATLTIEPGALRAFVDSRAGRLEAAGFEQVRVRLGGKTATLCGRVRVGERSADFTARVRVELAQRDLRLSFVDAYTFGYVRRPAPLLVHDLLCVLMGAVRASAEAGLETPSPSVTALGELVVHPLELFLARVLPQAGWRVPDVAALRVEAATLGATGVEIRYAPAAEATDALAAPEPPPWRAGDDALLGADLAGALARYRTALEALSSEPLEQILVTRILTVLCARDSSLREAEQAAGRALARWPDFTPAVLALASVATARGRDEEAVAHFERVLELAQASDEDVAVRAALTAARQVADPIRAAELYARVLARSPDDIEAGDALASLHLAAGRFSELIDLLRARIAATADARQQAIAHVRIAEVLLGKQGDHAAARVDLERAVRLDPENVRAWDLLARARAELGDARGAMEALDHLGRDRLATGPDDAVGRSRTLARVAAQFEEAGDPERARALFLRALELTPTDATVLEKLATLAVARGELLDAIALYPRLIAVCPTDPWRRRRAEGELLRLLVEVGDLTRARRVVEQLQDEPDPEVWVGLASLEQSAGGLDAALAMLERALRGVEPERAAALELERAALYARLGSSADRRAALERAYALAPEGPVALQAAGELAELTRAIGEPAAEGHWLDVLLGASLARADADELALRRAQLFLDGGDAAAARRLVEALREAGRESARGRRLFAEVLGQMGDPRGRAVVLEGLADDASDENDQLVLLVEASRSRLEAEELAPAQLLAKRAEAIAARAPTRLAKGAPGVGRMAAVMVRALLAEIAFHARSWDEAIGLYRVLLPSAVGGERVEWACRLGLACERIGQLDEALAAYRSAVEASEGEGEPLAAAWRRLAELEERSGDYAGAARTFRAAAADARSKESPAASADHLRRAAELLHRRLGETRPAIVALEEALRLEPASLAALDALEAIYSEMGDAPALERIALRKTEAARAFHLAELERDPGSLAALRFLGAEALRRGDRDPARRYFGALAERTASDERRGALITLAQLEREAGRSAEAEAHYWAALELSPPTLQVELLGQLESLFEGAERWSELAMALTHHASLVASAAEKSTLEVRRIRIVLAKLHEFVAAAEACAVSMRRAPGDARFWELFCETTRVASGAPGVKIALALVDHSQAGDAREAALTLLAAKVGEAALDGEVADLLFQALRAEVVALQAKSGTLGPVALRIFGLLQIAAESSGNFVALAEGLAIAAQVAGAPRAAAKLLRDSAALLRERVGDDAAAADTLTRALALAPDSEEVIAELEPLLRKLGELDRLSVAYERHLETLEGARRAAVLGKLGRLLVDELGDAVRGEKRLAEARAAQPPVSPRPRVGSKSESDPEIRRAKQQLASLPIDRLADIRVARLELARLERGAGHLRKARDLLETVLAEEPSNVAGLEALIELDQTEGRHADAASGVERLAQLHAAPVERAERLFEAAEIWRVGVGDVERAADAYLKIIDLDPGHVPTLRRLIEHFWRTGDRDSVIEMADALEQKGGLYQEETGPRLWARVAVAYALADQPARASRLQRVLGAGMAEELAAALVEAGRWSTWPGMVAAARLLARAPGPSAKEVRSALERLGAIELAERLS